MAKSNSPFTPDITPALKKKLTSLAAKYETRDFIKEDPSQFLYYYKNPKDIELCAFIASLLSFGSRKQFIPKIRYIMETADTYGGIYNWINSHDFEQNFSPASNAKFYRFYSYKDMYFLFEKLADIIYTEKTLGLFLSNRYTEKLNQLSASCQDLEHNDSKEKIPSLNLIDIIAEVFENCSIVPSTKTSAKKRLCMFLRWMVRDNSPVDIGLWPWFEKKNLLIPLDVHVLDEAKGLGLIASNATGTRKTAEELSKVAGLIFENDPCRLDFALFGLGVDEGRS